MNQSKDGTITDRQILFDVSKDTAVAAMGYTAAAAKSRDPRARKVFRRLARLSLDAREKTLDLLWELGGKG